MATVAQLQGTGGARAGIGAAAATAAVSLGSEEAERVINIVQRWPGDFPLGALAALKEIGLKLPTEPSAASAAPRVGSAQPATAQLGAGRERPATQRATVTTLANVEFALRRRKLTERGLW